MSEPKNAAANLDSVVARLEASQRRAEDPNHRRARNAGRRWAESTAEAAELRRLDERATTLRSARPDGWNWYFSDEHEARRDRVESVSDAMVHSLWPELASNPGATNAFWQAIAGEDLARDTPEHRQYVKLFCESALGVWRSARGLMKPL
jgi:hypothetical protein